MPHCTIYLISLNHSIAPTDFLNEVSALSDSPVCSAKVQKWIVPPQQISVNPLLTQNPPWDVFLIFPNVESNLLQDLAFHVRATWTLIADFSEETLVSYSTVNKRLLHPDPGTVPVLDSARKKQSLEQDDGGEHLMDPATRNWVDTFADGDGAKAVTMFNLLCFNPGKKDSYMEYVSEFATTVATKRGSTLKMAGEVVTTGRSGGDGAWETVALVHYPSIMHFADCTDSAEYKRLARKYKGSAGALWDTGILCLSELW